MAKSKNKRRPAGRQFAAGRLFSRDPLLASGTEINRRLCGLRLIAMESNGYDAADDFPVMRIGASNTTLRWLAARGDADHVIRKLQHKWLVTVVVVIKDWRGEYDAQTHFFFGWGKRVNDLSEEVQPKLDKIRDGVNAKFIVDWGWFAEILPTTAKDTDEQKERFKVGAEDFLAQMIEERHVNSAKYEAERLAKALEMVDINELRPVPDGETEGGAAPEVVRGAASEIPGVQSPAAPGLH